MGLRDEALVYLTSTLSNWTAGADIAFFKRASRISHWQTAAITEEVKSAFKSRAELLTESTSQSELSSWLPITIIRQVIGQITFFENPFVEGFFIAGGNGNFIGIFDAMTGILHSCGSRFIGAHWRMFGEQCCGIGYSSTWGYAGIISSGKFIWCDHG